MTGRYWTIAEAAEAIAARRLSPVELVDDCVARISEEEPHIRSFALLLADEARRQAKEAEREIVRRARDARDAVNAAVAAANRLVALDAKKARELVEDETGSTWCAACGDPIPPGQNRRGRCDACRKYAADHEGQDPPAEVLEARRAIRERQGAA